MKTNYHIFTSLTRISTLPHSGFSIHALQQSQWSTGDYVVCEVNEPYLGSIRIERTDGRMVEVTEGDQLVGALGERFATMEATGTWRSVGKDGRMEVLTGAGLFGRVTSRSMFLSSLIPIRYVGHVHLGGQKSSMEDFVPDVPPADYNTPTILMVGTSMSAGKTTAARIITRLLKRAGLSVLGAKLTGAGRYRDMLSVSDAGADHILDFVDVGLPSTVYPTDKYKIALRKLLSLMAGRPADVAVVEIGASPLEPYNGQTAIEAIRHCIKCTVLCASDPYAVYGVMKAFDLKPDIVSGVATNTNAGVALIEKLCNVTAFNLLDFDTTPRLSEILEDRLALALA
jgi:hypothetical protein